MWPLLEDEHGNAPRRQVDSGAETAEAAADHDDINAHESSPDFELRIDNCELGCSFSHLAVFPDAVKFAVSSFASSRRSTISFLFVGFWSRSNSNQSYAFSSLQDSFYTPSKAFECEIRNAN
jgi:hypothetical protein